MIMAAFELAQHYRSKQWKAAIIYTVLLLLLLASAVFAEFGIEFPDPMIPIQKIIASITGNKKI